MEISTRFSPNALATQSDINAVRAAWKRLSPLPGGKRLFSRFVGRAAPYTGPIRAVAQELQDGYCRMTMADRRSVRNHLKCVHAIALANLCEVTGNLALTYGLPDDARFIVAGMSLDYVKKARGTITGECTFAPIETSAKKEYEVPVVLSDANGDVVVRATLRTLVGPKT